jgi:hypothetical protein
MAVISCGTLNVLSLGAVGGGGGTSCNIVSVGVAMEPFSSCDALRPLNYSFLSRLYLLPCSSPSRDDYLSFRPGSFLPPDWYSPGTPTPGWRFSAKKVFQLGTRWVSLNLCFVTQGVKIQTDPPQITATAVPVSPRPKSSTALVGRFPSKGGALLLQFLIFAPVRHVRTRRSLTVTPF